ncbi:MAG: GH36-type glycosyl hydrolase domain-containing protein, partial [Longimicrobiales bacterium]
INHVRTPENAERYRTEPYAVAADIYAHPMHVGRGGWTWYTGSSGWMLRVALESVLGLDVDRGRVLRLRPRIPSAWPGYSISYRVPGTDTRYEIEVGREAGAVLSGRLEDGSELAVEDDVVLIPLVVDGRVHRVRVRVGPGTRYSKRLIPP